MTNATNQQVTRTEFEAGMRRIEALLDKQTEILQFIAATAAENRMRDQQLAELKEAHNKLQAEVAATKNKMAWYAGAVAALSAAMSIFAKKLGF